jgi:hypothetical protein
VRVIAEFVGIVAGVLTIAAFVARWWTRRQRQRLEALGHRRELPPPGDKE